MIYCLFYHSVPEQHDREATRTSSVSCSATKYSRFMDALVIRPVPEVCRLLGISSPLRVQLINKPYRILKLDTRSDPGSWTASRPAEVGSLIVRS